MKERTGRTARILLQAIYPWFAALVVVVLSKSSASLPVAPSVSTQVDRPTELEPERPRSDALNILKHAATVNEVPYRANGTTSAAQRGSPPPVAIADTPSMVPTSRFGASSLNYELERTRSLLPLSAEDDSGPSTRKHRRRTNVSLMLDRVRLSLHPDGEDARLREIVKGASVVVVHFWASWCKPCVQELSYVDALWRQHSKSADVAIIVVSVDMYYPDAKAVWDQHRLDFPLFLDPGSDALESLSGQSKVVPVTMVLQSDGAIHHEVLGQLTQDSARVIEQSLDFATARPR